MPIESFKLFERMQSLAPFEDASAARRAYDATLRGLRRGLLDDEADWLALDLGPELAAPLLRETYTGPLSIDDLYRWTARYAGVRRSVGREQAQVVCRVLAEMLSPAAAARLRRNLPELAVLLATPDLEESAPPPYRLRDERGPDHTLAAGRPGSDRPLYEARAVTGAEIPGGGPIRAHTHSVAASDDPHGDTRLSSSRGLTQEREHRSLSMAHPSTRK